ncbi:hypothetical protein IC575_017757 [Cucumis melo]
MKHNKMIFEKVSALAARKGWTTSQLALAWVHNQGNDVVPIPGTTKLQNLESNIEALSLKLIPQDMAELKAYALSDTVKGGRYDNKVITTWEQSDTPPLSSWNLS